MGVLRVTGVSGYLEGEMREVARGEELLVGRSRSCGLSLRRSRKWKAKRLGENEAEPAYRAVSRQHAAIRVLGEYRVEVEGFGKNGTFVDGVRIDRVLLTDLAGASHEVRVGPNEAIRIDWMAAPTPVP